MGFSLAFMHAQDQGGQVMGSLGPPQPIHRCVQTITYIQSAEVCWQPVMLKPE